MCQLDVLTKLILLLQVLCVSKAQVEFDTVQTSGSRWNPELDQRQAQAVQGGFASTDRSAGNVQKCPCGQCVTSEIHRRRAEDWELPAEL